MSEELLKLEKLAVFHGSFQALWDVSLVVRSREIVALIGANSAGKSTLLDTISGFINPSKGKVKFQSEDISALDPYRVVDLGITQVPEGRRIFPELSVLDNLIIGSYSRRARPVRGKNLDSRTTDCRSGFLTSPTDCVLLT